jgi:hypothetical protein
MEVRVLPVSFAKAYSDYQLCGKLLPMNYDQVRQTQVGFPGTASSWMLGACTPGCDPGLHEGRPDGQSHRTRRPFRQQRQPPDQP